MGNSAVPVVQTVQVLEVVEVVEVVEAVKLPIQLTAHIFVKRSIGQIVK
jgi:hypothetical protein